MNKQNDQIRKRLAKSAIESIFKIQIKDEVPSFVRDLFISLIKFDFDAEHIFTFRELIQKPQNPIILTELFFFLHTYFQTSSKFSLNNDNNSNNENESKEPSAQNAQDISNPPSNSNSFNGEEFFRAIIDSVGINVFNITSLSSTFLKESISTHDSSSIQSLDGKSMKLLYYAAQLASLFIQYIPNFLSNILITNSKSNNNDTTKEMQIDLNMINSYESQCLISFFITTLSFSGPNEEHLILLFKPVILKFFKKFTLKPLSFSILCLMSTHKKIQTSVGNNSSNSEDSKNQKEENEKIDKQSLKSVISFYKSLGSKSQSSAENATAANSALPQISSSDNLPSTVPNSTNSASSSSDFMVVRILTPIVIRIAISRLNQSILKELPSMISICASNIYNDQHTLQLFAYFIDQMMIYNDSPQLIKSKCDKIFDLYLQNISEKQIGKKCKNDDQIEFNSKKRPIENEIVSNDNDLSRAEFEDDLKIEDDEYVNSDPSNYIKPNIGAAFCLVMEKCKVSPFENGFFTSKMNDKMVNEVLMMAFYIINHVSVDLFHPSSYESLISLCLSLLTLNVDDKDETEKDKESKTEKNMKICQNFTFQLLIHYCAAIVVKYKSKLALSFLIQAVDVYGSKIASKVLSNNDVDILNFIFPSLARSFKPDKSHPVLSITIKNVLKNLISNGITFSLASSTKSSNESLLIQNSGNLTTNNTSSDSSSSPSRSNSISSFISMQHQHSCSNFLLSDNSSSNLSSISDTNYEMYDISRANVPMPDNFVDTISAPTDATILFCNVILSLEQHQYLFPLLPFAAAVISTHFSSALMNHFPKPFYNLQQDQRNDNISSNNNSFNSDADFEFEIEDDTIPSPKSFDDLKIDFLVNLHNRNPKKRKMMKNKYKRFKVNHKFKTGCLACFGNAIEYLDTLDIFSLSQTFLMFLPGQAMLMLGITLQRLPRTIVQKTLEKTTPFIMANPDEAGRMIALVSFSYPDIAISFIEKDIIENSPLKKRFFNFSFFSKNSYEKYVQTLTVVYKAIGYCSVFFDMNHFISLFLPFATRFLNQYLSDRYSMPSASSASNSSSSGSSNANSSSSGTNSSNSLHMASLFAIRKLCIRVAKWQESQVEHLFPFKDFLVQYVSAYYMEVGDLILIESNPIHLMPTSSQDDLSSEKIIDNESENKQESSTSENSVVNSDLIELVPCILSTFSSLLPLKPFRPSEKHEKSIELTAVLIQIIANDKKNCLSIIKASKLFYSTLLDCNSSVNVFIQILLPIFPALLYHKEWKQIAQLINFLCNKCVGRSCEICSASSSYMSSSGKWGNALNLNIQLSSEILSKCINDIGILISYVIPLTISKEACQIAFEILYSLVFIQCTIRNQILSLPQSIRPIKPDIDSIIAKNNSDTKNGDCFFEVNSVICSYLAKNFTTSQTFDVIFILLDFFEGKKLRIIHRIGVASSIKFLLKERGSEEFKFDSKIIQLLINAISSIEKEELEKETKKQKKKKNNNDNNSDSNSNEDLIYSNFMKKNQIISIFLEIFELMLNMRPFSVLSNIISLSDKISDGFLRQLVNNVIITKVQKGGEILLGVVADSFENIEIDIEEKEELTKKFAKRALPLLYDAIHEINHETWIKLFNGITKNEEVTINDPLMKMLAGIKSNNDYPSLQSLFSPSKEIIDFVQNPFFSFAKIIADERILLLPLLLSSFPEIASLFFINLSIAFAAASKETFFIFIEYAINAMIRNADNLDLFGTLKLVFSPNFVEFEEDFEMIEQLNVNLSFDSQNNSSFDLNNSKWAEFCESLTALLIRYMREDKAVVDCSIEFLKRIGYSCPHKKNGGNDRSCGGYLCFFWKNLAEVVLGNINSWILIIKRLIDEGEICFNCFFELLPLIIVNCESEDFIETIESIALKLGITSKRLEIEDGDLKKYNEELCLDVLKNNVFVDLINDFLNTFVTLMNDPKYINICCVMIGNLCETLTDENCFALSALIGQMPSDSDTYSFVIETLMRLLK